MPSPKLSASSTGESSDSRRFAHWMQSGVFLFPHQTGSLAISSLIRSTARDA
jgi:hypothetical protein